MCEITGHSRESSLEDYDQIDENRRQHLSHIITGYQGKGSICKDSKVSASVSMPRASEASSTNILALIPTSSSTDFNPNIQPNGFPFFAPQYPTISMSNCNGCTINNYFSKSFPSSSQPKKNAELSYWIQTTKIEHYISC